MTMADTDDASALNSLVVDSASEAGDLGPEQPAPLFTITVLLHNKPVELPFHEEAATIQDLSDTVAEDLHIPPTNQKFLITPKTGLLKPPFKAPELRLQTLQEKKIVLMGATSTEVDELTEEIAARKERMSKRKAALQAGSKVKVERRRDWSKVQNAAKYTFHTIKPLPYLPNPQKSQRFLERLAADPGIVACMAKRQFSVGLLTEMNPAEHTTQESRTLGLNRNRGEVIELRLRTDAYDGYRDYKVIRKTLCHELTHNVWGDHDQNFWNLCREIEKEVDKNDWKTGGHRISGDRVDSREEFLNVEDDGADIDEDADHGGWDGEDFVVGGSLGDHGDGMSRREIMARAAEERVRQMKEAKAKEEGK